MLIKQQNIYRLTTVYIKISKNPERASLELACSSGCMLELDE